MVFEFQMYDLYIRGVSSGSNKREKRKIMSKSKTQFITVRGKAAWMYKLYTPDEFRGSSNYTFNFYPLDKKEWKKIDDAGIQLHRKKDDGSRSGVEGEYLGLKRPTRRMFGNKLTFFTPPFIYDKDGKPLVRYLDSNKRPLYQYTNEGQEVIVEGEQTIFGNGSIVDVRLSVYDTQMGKGNRLESLKIIDAIEYEAPEDEVDPSEVEDGGDAPW